MAVNENSWKRCATHVHISHLIRIFQMPENQERLLLQPNQLKPQEGSKLGVLMAMNNFHGVRKSLNGIISPSNLCNSTTEGNSNEAKTGILQHQRLHQDQPQAALASGVYTPQKQVSLYCNCYGFFLSNVLIILWSIVRVSISCPCWLEVVGWKRRIVLTELEMG